MQPRSLVTAQRRTVVREVFAEGVALRTGVRVAMRIAPAVANIGIWFCRSDLPGRPQIPALWRYISDSRLATSIAAEDATVMVTEHVLAALAGAGIDDCLIELNGPEPPLLDGDALSFLELLDRAGICELASPREAIRVVRPIEVGNAKASARLLPSDESEFFFEIDFPGTLIGRQVFDCRLDEAVFRREIAPARTFGFLHQAEELRRAGYGLGASFDNTLVIDGDHLCNPEKQRFPDEFVRHKILDAIGDLKLAGAPLIARFEGRRSSHALNAALLRSLFSDPANYEKIA